MIPRVLVTVAVTLAALVATATAQPDYKSAAEHYKAAEAAMANADYGAAALEYGIAFDITKDPILYFKIGQANERAGKCPVALTYYRRYLKEGNPSDDYRRLTTERIAACSGPVVEVPKQPPVVDQPPVGDGVGEPPLDPGLGAGDDGLGDGGPSFTDTGASWQRKGAWIATGLTVGLAAAGAVLAMSAEGSEEDLQALIDFRNGGRPVRYDEIDDQYTSLTEDGERFDQLATFALAGAGATAAIAVTLFILDGTRGAAPGGRTARLQPTVDRHGGGVVIGWGF